MAETATPTRLKVTQWLQQFYVEYVRKNRFNKYMGRSINNIIQMQEDLSKKKGHQVVFSLVNALSGQGTMGSETLEGAEEELKSDGFEVAVKYIRNAVAIDDEENDMGLIDYLKAAKPQLQKWMMERTRDHIITAMMSMQGKAYLSSQIVKNPVYTQVATQANRDTWLAANSDRVLFGAAKSNNAANDHSAALSNLDNTNDKLSVAIAGLAKRMAQTTDPAISPVTVNDEQEWYVMFCNSNSFRDLKADTTLSAANREARVRAMMKNPIFTDGDEVYNGIIYREVPEIPNLGAVGAGNIQVGVNFLCGLQAVGFAIARRPFPIRDTRDYGFVKGVGIAERRGIAKLQFKDPSDASKLKDHGVFTLYTASVDDV
jgi:N4-gp56 family major capsid protein